MTRRRWTAVPLALCSGVLLAACGVGVDAAPNVISNKSVPYGLTLPSPPTTASGTPGTYVTIYLEGATRLVAASRVVTGPVSVNTVLRAVAAGPTAEQAASGLASPASSAAPLDFVHLVNTVATIDVSPSFTTLAQKEQEVAVAQLVFTVTAFPGVHAIKIRIDGHTVQVPMDKGTLSRGSLTRTDYATFSPY